LLCAPLSKMTAGQKTGFANALADCLGARWTQLRDAARVRFFGRPHAHHDTAAGQLAIGVPQIGWARRVTVCVQSLVPGIRAARLISSSTLRQRPSLPGFCRTVHRVGTSSPSMRGRARENPPGDRVVQIVHQCMRGRAIVKQEGAGSEVRKFLGLCGVLRMVGAGMDALANGPTAP